MLSRLQKWGKKKVRKVLLQAEPFHVPMEERKGESKRAGGKKNENKTLHKLQFIFCIKKCTT